MAMSATAATAIPAMAPVLSFLVAEDEKLEEVLVVEALVVVDNVFDPLVGDVERREVPASVAIVCVGDLLVADPAEVI